jgi:polysaccharide pyruvyl transferase WcaK-like protein
MKLRSLDDFCRRKNFGSLPPGVLAKKRILPKEVTVIGADAIAGDYGLRDVLCWVGILNAVAISGGRAQLVNFSLPASIDPSMKWILRGLDKKVEIWVRDTVSQSRAEVLLRRNVGVAPDIANWMGVERLENGSGWDETDRPNAVVVVNGHLEGLSELGNPDGGQEFFRTVIQVVSAAGFHVSVMAHDLRDSPGDPKLARDVARLCREDDILPGVIIPEDARSAKVALSRFDLVVSARMHAAIAALSSGVPTLGIGYLGKFEGQFRWYDQEQYVVPAKAATSGALSEALSFLKVNLDSTSKAVQDKAEWVHKSGPLWCSPQTAGLPEAGER